jgi:transposase-like protein
MDGVIMRCPICGNTARQHMMDKDRSTGNSRWRCLKCETVYLVDLIGRNVQTWTGDTVSWVKSSINGQVIKE